MTARSEGFGRGRLAPAGQMQGFAASDAAAPPRGLRLTGIGVALRDARESRGITFANAERDTHIPRHHLQALEEERFGAFHAPVYARGFLRSYSQYLGLNSADLLALMPPDSPPEAEELQPLSRLGRPRGPHEAARARRSPAARDAAPVRSTPSGAIEPDSYDDALDPDRTGRLRFAIDARDGDTVRTARLDPLGRLGWPERLESDEERASTPWLNAPDTSGANPFEPFEEPKADPPRSHRAPLRRQAQVRNYSFVPADVSAIFAPRALAIAAALLLALAILYALVAALGGGDQSPTVLADTGPVATATATATVIRDAPGLATAHGTMPNLRGADLPAALAALKSEGVTPVVVQQTVGSQPQLVSAQSPAPGTRLNADIPVLVIAGQGN